MDKIRNRIIRDDASIFQALEKMDAEKVKMLFVFNESMDFLGILTIGDIQRSIIRKNDLGIPISMIIDKDKVYCSPDDPREKVEAEMRRLRAECMPIVDSDGVLHDVVLWEDIFGDTKPDGREKIDLPVVIMAGGKGTRLKPLTNVIPKPLVPVGDKTIIEEIMDQFESIGCHKFYLSVNYKFEILKFYLDNLDHHYDMEFIKEDKPLGTIGSVSMLKGRIKTPFFVSTCDSLIDQDYRDAYDYHRSNNNEITVISAIKREVVPYGVIHTGEDGIMTGLSEKPENTYMLNIGIYILEPDVVDEIPEGEFFHITDLIQKVRGRGGQVGCFPVSENAWKDMGDWDEYLKIIGR